MTFAGHSNLSESLWYAVLDYNVQALFCCLYWIIIIVSAQYFENRLPEPYICSPPLGRNSSYKLHLLYIVDNHFLISESPFTMQAVAHADADKVQPLSLRQSSASGLVLPHFLPRDQLISAGWHISATRWVCRSQATAPSILSARVG